jgi:hypothetical protein
MASMTSSRICTGLIAAALLFDFALPLHAKEFIKGESSLDHLVGAGE